MKITPITSSDTSSSNSVQPDTSSFPHQRHMKHSKTGKGAIGTVHCKEETSVNNNKLAPVKQFSSLLQEEEEEEQETPQAASGMVVILSDHFKVLCEPSFSKSRLKKCSVRLTDTHLSWGTFESQSSLSFLDENNLTVIPVPEVIGTQIKDGNLISSTASVDSVAITIFAYPFKDNPSRSIYSKNIPRRVRKSVTFIVDSGSSYCENHDLADKWSRAIEWLVFDKALVKASNRICDVSIPTGHPFKRNILVMINPASGPGKAGNIFQDKVAPLLDEGGINHHVWNTTSAGSASHYIANCSLEDWHGIVIVSGDGLVYELFNGLMQRKDYQTAIQIPVGVIPGGSGNGLAHSINFYVGENTCNPILASTLNIVRGRVVPMDLVKVEMRNEETVYSFLSIGWGLLADIDIESERLRMMGGFRFTVWALYRIFSLKKYRGTLSYLPVPGSDQRKNPFNGDIVPDKSSSALKSQPEDGSNNLPRLNEPVPSDWVTVTDEFILVYTGHQSHLSGDCFFAPSARLDDGIIWLVFIQSGVSKAQIFTFMTSLESGQHCELPFITMVPVKAFRLVPFQDEGRLTVDGELVPTGPVQASVLPSIARIMSR